LKGDLSPPSKRVFLMGGEALFSPTAFFTLSTVGLIVPILDKNGFCPAAFTSVAKKNKEVLEEFHWWDILLSIAELRDFVCVDKSTLREPQRERLTSYYREER
jgi:hypothetical protein